MTFTGFPRGTRHTPVPNPIFGPLLEQIDNLAELKCTLRIVWLLHQKRGYPRFVTRGELLADRTMARSLSSGDDLPSELDRAMARAIGRGTLLCGTVELKGRRETAYALNSEADRKALAGVLASDAPADEANGSEEWDAPLERPSIFSLYEDNIGMITPIIADELREAEELYPARWIEDAMREAVDLNRRSWRYVARILERWEREGRDDGGTGRHPQKAGHKRYY